MNLMMSYPLTLAAILRRAETHFGHKEIVSVLPDGRGHRTTYGALIGRAKRLALALRGLGVEPGDRVATLCWNHHRHLEAYFGVTAGGMVLHTLNLRLHAGDLDYIARHAGDKVLLVDEVLLPLALQFWKGPPRSLVVMAASERSSEWVDYEALLASVDEAHFQYPDLDENHPAALCYTSGTTGNPKGVLYSHRALALHSLAVALPDAAGLGEADVVYPVVPMFHANCWGLPFVAALVGAKQVLAGPHADPPQVLRLLADEGVTVSAGVPTVWLGVLQELDRKPGAYDLSRLRRIISGGSAVPAGLLRGLQERHRIHLVQLWGMTEMSPIGTMCLEPCDLAGAPAEERYAYRARQGMPLPFIEVRARGAQGLIPWDGQATGELEVRGAWVIASYYQSPESAKSFTADGWFKTGDIVRIDRRGCIEIQDRAKDLIKSGGEWISSVALENALMGHSAVAEAAVVAVAHEKWQERPLACVVLKEGRQATAAELIDFLRPSFAKWWLPDAVVFLDAIPRTPSGKFLKKELRERFKDYLLEGGSHG